MSVVTTVILTCSVMEGVDDDNTNPPLNTVNDFLLLRDFGQLADLGLHFGGRKVPQVLAYGGAFNHLNHREFLAAIAAAGWAEPQNVQVFISGEDDERFTEMHLVFAAAHHRLTL